MGQDQTSPSLLLGWSILSPIPEGSGPTMSPRHPCHTELVAPLPWPDPQTGALGRAAAAGRAIPHTRVPAGAARCQKL